MVRASWFQEEPDSYGQVQTTGQGRSLVQIFLVINIAAFVVDYIGHNILTNNLGLNCNLIRSLYFPLLLVQLITYQFLHHGTMHILFNMLMLWFFGRELESYMGRRKFAFLYLVSGVAGGLTQILVGVLLGGEVLPHVVGASGAIYGILIYYALKWPDRTVIFIVVSLRARTLALIMVGISVLYGFFPASGDSTSHMCHLGGALLGFLYYRYEGGYKRVVATIKIHQDQKTEQKSMDQDKEMDRLLLKIHEEGIHALTDKERKFLNEASRRYRKS